MVELVVAGLLVLWFRDRLAIPPDAFLTTVAVLWAPLYLLGCSWRPYTSCPSPWCTKRNPTAGDGRGNYRRRRPCRVCGNQDFRRIGARLIGRG